MAHPLSVAFVWHMHQPYYRDLATGACAMPWVRLHATKDYLDMVQRLEAFPTIHQTFNIVPSLIDQIEEYLPPAGKSDAFLELSRRAPDTLSPEDQHFILRWFFMANHERMVKPHPAYHDLLAKRGLHVDEQAWPAVLRRFKPQDYRDLQAWFNLVWIDPWLRSQDPELARLEAKGKRFTEDEKRYILDAQQRILARVIPAYREAAARGQIELTTSPYYHPILPLLCDTNAARQALPHVALPAVAFRRPEDARWHLQQSLARHEQAFGRRAEGLWPSEGSVSEAVAGLAIEAGLKWIATDEEMLWRTLRTGRSPSLLYRPHRIQRAGGETAIVFRDRELSDLVGFTYSQWEPRSAAADLIKRLHAIQEQVQPAGQSALVSIILDGENAWEGYHNDGHDFFTALYEGLAADARLRCVTVGEFLREHPASGESLPEVSSGSWIGGNFATWIGHPEKNAAWVHLAAARDACGPPPGREDVSADRQAAWRSLGAAEGSDWMWWFGDTHFTAQADEFDQLFRTHVANSYRFAGLTPPTDLERPIRQAAGQPADRPTGLIHPVIDGRETSYYEWLYAGRLDLTRHYTAIQRGGQYLVALRYGFDEQRFYLAVDCRPELRAEVAAWSIELRVGPVTIRITPGGITTASASATVKTQDVAWAFDRLLEVALPIEAIEPTSGGWVPVAVVLSDQGQPLERYPGQGTFDLLASGTQLELHAWPI